MIRPFRFTLLPVLIAFSIAAHSQASYPADTDTAFNKASGTPTITLDSNRIANLTNLGMLWGFIKYYHAGVKQGAYNMDAELFRILPLVIAAQTEAAAYRIMEEWVDHFGVPAACPNCRMVTRTENVKLSPDYGYLFNPDHFPKSLINKLYFIRNNRDTGYHHYYAERSFSGNVVFMHEKEYKNNWYPDAGLRLLAAYRYWNIVQYYSPYRHLFGCDWNTQLSDFIVSLNYAADKESYITSCKKMVATLHDGHANISGENNDSFISNNRLPPVRVMFIEGKLVVVGYDDTLSTAGKIKPGDVIEEIDNVPVDTLIQRMLPYVSGSNYANQLYTLSLGRALLLTTKRPTIRLTINNNGKLHHAETPTLVRPKPPYGCFPFQPATNEKGYKILADNIGYIYPANLFRNSTDTVMQVMSNTRGLIIDMRGYPRESPLKLMKWMRCDTLPFEASAQMAVDAPGMFEDHQGSWFKSCKSGCYAGKVVIVVNQSTISQAEFCTMGLAKIMGAVVIGDTTAGADGDVSVISLPGALKTRISGVGISCPDGTETQRRGIKIDKIVRPTIAGIKAHKDEQLDAAIKIIEETK